MNRILPYLWYPLLFVAAIIAFAVLLNQGYSPAAAVYPPIIAVGIVILVLEWQFPERVDWRPRKADVKADVAFMVLIQIVVPQALAGFVAIALADMYQDRSGGGLWPHAWPLAAQVIAMVLGVDFLRYWLHRACHVIGPLWRLHEVHHSPDILYVLNVARFHPLEKALHFSFDTVPFVLLGAGPEVIAGYFLAYSVNGFFQHSNIRLRYGVLNYIVGSAETHRWHHARDPRTAQCNFGNTTIVWDLLFRTWFLPADGRGLDIGIMDRAYPTGFLAQMAIPFRRRG
jgi:sterol desaturase/sphingolipid hydroxylase (fatty acid hydroxylase superfamily)